MNESILDDDLEIKPPSSYLLSVLLVCNTIFIWMNIKIAGNLPYDDNYGCLMLSLIASLLGCILIILCYYFKARQALLKNGFIVFLFLLSSSPISIIYIAFHYKEIFGVALAN
jgi:hypothetical protein